MDGTPDAEIAATLSRRFGVPPAISLGQVEAALSLDRHERALAEPVGEFRYEKIDAGYRFARGDRVLVTVDDRGDALELVATDPSTRHSSQQGSPSASTSRTSPSFPHAATASPLFR